MKEMIESAVAQFVGYTHATRGFGLLELVSSMGLTEREWRYIRSNEIINSFTQSEIEEIDEYFKLRK